MYPESFDYYRATSVQHALELLVEHDDAEILAGGHSLLPTMKSGVTAPDVLVDITDIEELRGIRSDNGTTSIGATVRYTDLIDSTHLREQATVLIESAEVLGDRQIRNRGTIGGNISHADPASDLTSAVLAADATMVVRAPDGERTIPADEFFLGRYTTAMAEDELLTRIEVENETDNLLSTYLKKESPLTGYALVGVAAALELDGGSVKSARIAANGVIGHPVRLSPVEEALRNAELTPTAIDNAAARATDDIDMSLIMDDLQASATFRSQLLTVYTKRAIERLRERTNTM